jgi:hypothetical protein
MRFKKLLTASAVEAAAGHPHPDFNRDGAKILIQSAVTAPQGYGGNMDLCLMPVPRAWLNGVYS